MSESGHLTLAAVAASPPDVGQAEPAGSAEGVVGVVNSRVTWLDQPMRGGLPLTAGLSGFKFSNKTA